MPDVTNAKAPMIPRHPTNPVGQVRRIQKARKAYLSDIRDAQKFAVETLESWPRQVRNTTDFRGNAFYDYLIDISQLTRLVEEIVRILRTGRGVDAVREAAEAAYREGTAKAVENLSGILDDYARTVTGRLGDQTVLRRAALAGARAFEQMTGFAEDTGADLARVLFRAVQDGENPRDTARTIRERFKVSRSRADRIARTEITGALRRGRWDEARDTQERLGEEVRLIHYSALIAGRTRRSHAQRHGKIVTVEEEAAWYAQDGNAINCLCTQSEVIVDESGEPVFGKKLIERMKERRKQFLQAGVEAGST